MPEAPNRTVRLVVPLLLMAAGIGLFFLVIAGPGARQKQQPSTNPAPSAGAQPAAAAPGPGADATAASTGAAPQPAAGDVPSAASPPTAGGGAGATAAASVSGPAPAGLYGLRARRFPLQVFRPLGRVDQPKGQAGVSESPLAIDFAGFGAGVERLRLADHFEQIDHADPLLLQARRPPPLPNDQRLGATPFAAERVTMNGQDVLLALDPADSVGALWREVEGSTPGTFEAVIETADGTAVARVVRRYIVTPGSYEFTLEQSLENLSAMELRFTWRQFGPVDLPMGVIRYGGDTRRLRFGYRLPPSLDPARIVLASEFLIAHDTLLGKHAGLDERNGAPWWEPRVEWPNERSRQREFSLAWTGMTSRYFVVAVHEAQPGAGAQAVGLSGWATVERLVVATGPYDHFGIFDSMLGVKLRRPPGVAVLRLSTPELTAAPGQRVDLSLSAYAGPVSKRVIKNEPAARTAGLDAVVVYTFGGPCGFCTFQPITRLLRWFLGVLHDYVVFDYALGIMCLVVCVRTLLHPVTRWSQVNLLRFGKQMQAVGPKMKALQDKFKNDPTKLREEQARLMREEGINYGQALGCLPMFLQTPVWIALYAMLYFTYELRHEPAFFGVFQALTGNAWGFLGDLSEPDKLLNLRPLLAGTWFAEGIPIPFLSAFMGRLDAVNLLPIVMVGVFWLQQKYMQPPTTAQLSPEQEQQQKIAKFMIVFIFPFFMYNAPCGLALYFLTNSVLGILETKWIRAHVDKSELEPKKPAAAPKATLGRGRDGQRDSAAAPAGGLAGWLLRMQQRAEEYQKMREKMLKEQQRRPKGRR